jgi:hypothetical protein
MPESISALFDDLRQEVQLVLLFLKSIRSIEVLQLLPGQTQPQLLFSCSVANADAALLRQRALFLHAASAPADELVSGTYKLDMVLRCVTHRACAYTMMYLLNVVACTAGSLVQSRRGLPFFLEVHCLLLCCEIAPSVTGRIGASAQLGPPVVSSGG